MKQLVWILLIGVGVLQTSNAIIREAQVKKEHVYYVILAGGRGERLWPLSRQQKPKQLLSIDGRGTLLEQAIDRVSELSAQENIWVCTTHEHEHIIRDAVGHRIGRVLAEPSARNTGPAILFCCTTIAQIDPEALIVFLPADAYIPAKENDAFRNFLTEGIHSAATHDCLLLFGMKPSYPSTGYGYIEHEKSDAAGAHKVVQFHEKPDYDVACEYVAAGNKLFNLCMFCAKASVFIDEFKKHAPLLWTGVMAYNHGQVSYEQIEAKSIDYAVLEKSDNVWVLPVEFIWADAGNVTVFLLLKQQAHALHNNLIVVDAQNNLIDAPDTLVALVGVQDLCIVQTKDALLVTKRNEAEKVRAIVRQLKEKGYNQYL